MASGNSNDINDHNNNSNDHNDSNDHNNSKDHNNNKDHNDSNNHDDSNDRNDVIDNSNHNHEEECLFCSISSSRDPSSLLHVVSNIFILISFIEFCSTKFLTQFFIL